MTEFIGRGKTDEWYTPPEIFDALGIPFDLDPCSPHKLHWTPATAHLVKEDDGLATPWWGSVFMNPPFGGRNGIVPWLQKFVTHGAGIGIAPARTSCGWFQEFMPQMDYLLFPKGKTKFVPGPGVTQSNPMGGVVIFSLGVKNNKALVNSGLGLVLKT